MLNVEYHIHQFNRKGKEKEITPCCVADVVVVAFVFFCLFVEFHTWNTYTPKHQTLMKHMINAAHSMQKPERDDNKNEKDDERKTTHSDKLFFC